MILIQCKSGKHIQCQGYIFITEIIGSPDKRASITAQVQVDCDCLCHLSEREMIIIARFSGYSAQEAAKDFAARNGGTLVFVEGDMIVFDGVKAKAHQSYYLNGKWLKGAWQVIQEKGTSDEVRSEN